MRGRGCGVSWGSCSPKRSLHQAEQTLRIRWQWRRRGGGGDGQEYSIPSSASALCVRAVLCAFWISFVSLLAGLARTRQPVSGISSSSTPPPWGCSLRVFCCCCCCLLAPKRTFCALAQVLLTKFNTCCCCCCCIKKRKQNLCCDILNCAIFMKSFYSSPLHTPSPCLCPSATARIVLSVRAALLLCFCS